MSYAAARFAPTSRFGLICAIQAHDAEHEIDVLMGRVDPGPDPLPIRPWRGPVGFWDAEAFGPDGYHFPSELTDAQRKRSKALRASMPWNIVRHVELAMGYVHRRDYTMRDQAILHRRLEGFFRALVLDGEQYPLAVEYFSDFVSERGVYSPYTWGDPAGLIVAADFSPGRIETALRRTLRSAVRRAVALRAEGVHVPRIHVGHIADAILRRDGGLSVGRRAAIVAVARASGAILNCPPIGKKVGTFRQARHAIEWLRRAIRNSAVMTGAVGGEDVHGVRTWRTTPWHRVRRYGVEIQVARALWLDHVLQHGLLVRTPDGHVFHYETRFEPFIRYYGKGSKVHAPIVRDTAEAANAAMKAFIRRQRQLAKSDVLKKLASWPSDAAFVPLIYAADSYAVGNCTAGTSQWVRQHMHHWAGRPVAPLTVAVFAALDSGNELAMRAVSYAADKLADAGLLDACSSAHATT